MYIEKKISSINFNHIFIPTKSQTSPCSLKLSRSTVLISRLSSPAQYVNVTFVVTLYNERHNNSELSNYGCWFSLRKVTVVVIAINNCRMGENFMKSDHLFLTVSYY